MSKEEPLWEDVAMVSRAVYRQGLRVAVSALVVVAILTGSTCPPRNGEQPATRPAPPPPKWPGTTGQVNLLAVWLVGQGEAGLGVVVQTVQEDRRRRVTFVFEDGSFTFRVYAADPTGKPILETELGKWDFDEAATRAQWMPKGFLGQRASFAFPLPWSGPAPAPFSNLFLATEFKPHGRDVTVAHDGLPFTLQPTLPPKP